MRKIFPTLYKKTSTGASQMWQIEVNDNKLITHWGQVNGKIQEGIEVIKEGKNIGRSNETTPEQQALVQAESDWKGKLKKGYVEKLEDAKAGKTDSIIEGGIFPMLAHKYSEQGHKIVFPAYAQPKLDGHRCIGSVKRGQPSLWSRTRKPITSMPHIIDDIAKTTGGSTIDFDGELYNHQYHNDFEKLSHFIRLEEPEDGCDIVQYHIYDMADNRRTFKERLEILNTLKFGPSVHIVETLLVNNEDELMEAFQYFLNEGYEGAIVRNANALYVNKRSYDLQKVKEFDDSEFKVIGVEEGKGTMAGRAIFVCETADGTRFNAKMVGKMSDLEKYIKKPSLAIGKQLTVKYQGLTGKNKVPRFPVALRFREND